RACSRGRGPRSGRASSRRARRRPRRRTRAPRAQPRTRGHGARGSSRGRRRSRLRGSTSASAPPRTRAPRPRSTPRRDARCRRSCGSSRCPAGEARARRTRVRRAPPRDARAAPAACADRPAANRSARAGAEELERAGYLPVGREFPVFLHPESHEEYALARLERKVAPGYRGFTTQASPEVTLEEDLRRRDLTINAMAESPGGEIIDPYGGQADLTARVLRHVSDAFVEDPVRILRVARFAARYAGLGFRVADETLQLMRRMTDAGDAAALVAERAWQETERALGESRPEVFFETLRACGALAVIFP